MRYGRQVVMVANGAIVEQSEAQFVNWGTVRKLVKNTETIKVKNADQVMAEFLKLLDLHKSGQARDIGIFCKVDPDNSFTLVEKTWIVQDLKEQELKDNPV
jgi:hypothetical protein